MGSSGHRALLLVLGTLAAPSARAQEPAEPALLAAPDGLDPAARAFFAEAESTTDPARAAALYRIVLGQDPGYLPAALGLARALLASGQRQEAEVVYRRLGTEPDAVEGLALLLEADRPQEALRQWHLLETLRLGDPTPYLHQARLYATVDPDRALAAWTTYQTLLQGGEPDGPTLLAVAAALLGAERGGEAEALLRAYLDAHPEGRVAAEARARLARMEVERAAVALSLGGAEPLTPALEERRREIARLLTQGKVGEAEPLARALVAQAPRSDGAHGLYADVLAAQRRWSEAEVQAALARDLAPEQAEHRLRMAWLLSEAYGGRRDGEALDELRQAAALRPGEPEVLLRLARLEQAQRHYDRALARFEEVARGEGELAEEARRAAEALRRVPPPLPGAPEGRPLALPPEAARPYRIALVYLGRGELAAARAELDAALAVAPDAPALLNLLARLAREQGDLRAAEAALEGSLAADPSQGAVLFALGELALGRGEREAARARFVEAAARGEGDAWYLLARMAAADGDWAEVRSRIEAYEAAGARTSLYREGARLLGAEAARRWWASRLAVGGLVVVGLGAPLAWWARRRTASTLRDLLDGAPESWHEAARALAALRHEVLKHNTTVLPDVASALERGDARPWELLRARAPVVLGKFDAYLDALESLGRRHGHRLDLRGTDPILAPMHRALRRLAHRRGPPSPAQLRAWSEVVNERGYQEIGRLVNTICILPITPELVRAVFDRVAAEPGFAGGGLPEPELVDEGGVHQVRMFRDDLDDILANLLRNALGAGARRVRVSLGETSDPVTGQPWVEIRVGDDAPGTLTNAMIRGRYIGRGLGLAVDLLNRHGGTIRVEAGPPGEAWKDVVVQLVAVEAAPVEVEWTA